MSRPEITPQERVLMNSGIRPTAMRLLIYRTLNDAGRPLSSPEIEDLLDTADHSTVSRTLSLLLSHGLIHSIDDGGGAVRFEICHAPDSENDEDSHAHFRCLRCGRTECLTDVHPAMPGLPAGYRGIAVNYIVKGICAECSGSGRK